MALTSYSALRWHVILRPYISRSVNMITEVSYTSVLAELSIFFKYSVSKFRYRIEFQTFHDINVS